VPTDIEWNAIRDEAHKQSVFAFMVEGLNHLSSNQRPPQVLLLQWIAFTQMTETIYALQCERAKELILSHPIGNVEILICGSLETEK
jgi:hypothetical protein